MKPSYAVLRFSLKTLPEGKPTQEVERCGEFDTAEAAFTAARQGALQAWRQERKARGSDETAKIIYIEDTEWGYDLRCENLVFTRFWIHDTSPVEISAP